MKDKRGQIKFQNSMTSQERVEEIIKTSGNSFHYKVVDFLRGIGWRVLVSPFYSDIFTDKSREIDIIAEKEFGVTSDIGDYIGSISVRLFIECKYIVDDVVFWFDKKDLPSAIHKILFDTPLESPDRWSMTKKHRYYEDVMVAKLFSSGNNRTQDNEVFYKAIIQSLNSMVYFKNKQLFVLEDQGRQNNPMVSLNYPLIVCNSFENFWKYDVITKDISERIKNNFQIEVQYAYFDIGKDDKREYFLVDVLSLSEFGDFIKYLENKDVAAVKEKIMWDADAKELTR